MKFDAVVANPPYQEKVGPNKTLPIWNKIVERSLKVLKDGGTMTMVHPSGWRNVDGNFKKIQKEILSYDLKDLEIHDEADGLKTFGTETRYDIYTLEKTKVDKTNTRIKFQDGTKMTLDVSNLEFIPNDSYELFNSLIAKKGEERVEVISDSTYHTQRPHLSREENNVFKYPCIYTINNEDIPTNGNGENKPWYSSVKEKHFEIPKLIWSNGRITSVGSFIDDAGEYGVTQFSYAIVDDVENLPLIKKAFDSAEFRKLMMAGAVGLNQIPYKVISTFRKDFWKKFV